MTELAGFGTDTWCLDSLSPGRFARGANLVAQAAYKRLITPRGTLSGGDEETAYGLDVASYVGAVGTAIAIRTLPGQVRAQLLQDDRLSEADVTAAIATAADGTVSITLAIVGTLADESGTFTLTLAVSDVDATVLGITTTT